MTPPSQRTCSPAWARQRLRERSARASFRCIGRRRSLLRRRRRFECCSVPSIANLHGVTSRLDWYLDRVLHFHRPGPLTVDHDIVRATTTSAPNALCLNFSSPAFAVSCCFLKALPGCSATNATCRLPGAAARRGAGRRNRWRHILGVGNARVTPTARSDPGRSRRWRSLPCPLRSMRTLQPAAIYGSHTRTPVVRRADGDLAKPPGSACSPPTPSTAAPSPSSSPAAPPTSRPASSPCYSKPSPHSPASSARPDPTPARQPRLTSPPGPA